MPTLTEREADALATVRRYAPTYGEWGVPASVIRDSLRHRQQMPYDAVNRALRGCVDKGLLIKPSRGYYRPS